VENLYAVVLPVRDDDVLPGGDGDALQPLELAGEGPPLAEAPDALAVGREHLDAVVAAVHHVHVVVRVQRHASEEQKQKPDEIRTKRKNKMVMPRLNT